MPRHLPELSWPLPIEGSTWTEQQGKIYPQVENPEPMHRNFIKLNSSLFMTLFNNYLFFWRHLPLLICEQLQELVAHAQKLVVVQLC